VHIIIYNKHDKDICVLYIYILYACRIGSLNRVLRTAARLVVRTPKFGHVSEYTRDELHWLSYPHRIAYGVSAFGQVLH